MQLPKLYIPADYESDIYALWEKTGAFVPSGHGKPFSIVIPPPNANGNLHLGHALTLGLEDIAVRFHRAQGEDALLLPGADHAGFETQVVFERELAKVGKSRFDFSRASLYEQIYDYVRLNRTNFESQIRALGAGVDWGRMTFTLDEKIVNQAYATFKKMWQAGLIYRGERLVNFCTFHGTAFADIEVVYENEPGSLWYMSYPLVDGSGAVQVATTRPETMLGDTAVAVNPDDDRYTQYIGKTVRVPLTNREVPVIADSYVDMKFGTGAVKITPAHDPNDFEVGQRHDLPMINVIDTEGKLTNDVPAAYRGLTVAEARQKVVADLDQTKALVKTEKHDHNVGHCYKCGTIIQPLLREQWFVRMEKLAQPAIAALKAKKITFFPDSKRIQLISYLEHLRDWNISRQIAWGIPIPAFQNIDEPDDWIYDERVNEETIVIGDKTYRRDPDVFDTWFSSSSWPYATLNYPAGDSFQKYYPLSVMETGADILMPWVSRMIMLGLYVTGEVPFTSVYLHGLIMDEHGQKMSKSKGNVINPLDVVASHGSDALRMGIISGQTPGNNQPFDYSRVVGARNFCNKLWNIARYIEDQIKQKPAEAVAANSPADHWILSKLQQSQSVISKYMADYRFSEAYESLYHFVWDDVADWYLEAAKVAPNIPLLAYVLEATLVLTHPFAPFVTETIWQTLDWEADTVLARKQWAVIPKFSSREAKAFTELQTIVIEARYIIGALHATDVTLYYTAEPMIDTNRALIKKLAKLLAVEEVRDGTGLFLTTTPYRCWLDIDGATTQQFAAKLQIRISGQQGIVDRLNERLHNKNYLAHAPHAIVAETEAQLVTAQTQLQKLTAEYDRFTTL